MCVPIACVPIACVSITCVPITCVPIIRVSALSASTPMALPHAHHVFGTPLDIAPPGTEIAIFGMGCFWGAEQHFFHLPGVVSTAVGYAGGSTPNPTYREVCSGNTGHAEVVRVVFDPQRVEYGQLLRVFWENHDPTQGMRQGNDFGTQYRSAIYTTSEAQRRAALSSRDRYAAETEGEPSREVIRSPPRSGTADLVHSRRAHVSCPVRPIV